MSDGSSSGVASRVAARYALMPWVSDVKPSNEWITEGYAPRHMRNTPPVAFHPSTSLIACRPPTVADRWQTPCHGTMKSGEKALEE